MKKQKFSFYFLKFSLYSIVWCGVFRAPFSGFGAVSNVMQKQSSGRSTPASIKGEKGGGKLASDGCKTNKGSEANFHFR